MDVRQELQKAIKLGVSISFIARKINKDPSTLNKWLHGTKNVSLEVEKAVQETLIELKEAWMNIMSQLSTILWIVEE